MEIPRIVTLAALAWGCGKGGSAGHAANVAPASSAVPVAPAGTVSTDSGVVGSQPVPGPPATVPAPNFALVSCGPTRLHRLLTGQVIGTTQTGDVQTPDKPVFYALGSDGGVARLHSVESAIRAAVGEVGTVGGSWPGTLFVERFSIQYSSVGLVVQGDDAHARVVRTVRGGYFRSGQWRDGATLAARIDGHSDSRVFGSRSLDGGAHLEIVGTSSARPPRFPKDALFDDAFVAYPNGRVFALGGRRTRPVIEEDASEFEAEKGYMLDGALVWQTDAAGSGFVAVQLPGTTPRDRLLHGKFLAGAVETETLVWGQLQIWKNRHDEIQPYLARFESGGWRRLPTDRTIRQLSRGSDGTLWAIAGIDSIDDQTWLERVSWTPNGDLQFVRAEFAARPEWLKLAAEAGWGADCPAFYPRDIVVTTAADIWLTAQCVTPEYAGTEFLLHTSPQRPLVSPESAVEAPRIRMKQN